jgi:hypothetical protein
VGGMQRVSFALEKRSHVFEKPSNRKSSQKKL